MKNYQKLEIGQKEFFSNRLLKKTILLHALLAAVCYIIFFLIMRAVNLLHVTELRFVNYAIFGFAGYMALKELRKHISLNYFQDFGAAFLTGIVSFFFLAVFLYIYLHIDSGFSEYLTSHVVNGMSSTPSEISIILFFEGSAMSAIVTLCIMQYFKRFMDKE
jgi:hypothetical protein